MEGFDNLFYSVYTGKELQSDEPISSREEYAYENTENSIKVYLPESSGEYVAVTDSGDSSLSFSQIGEKEVSVKKKSFRFLGEREQIAEYADVFGEGCDLQYVPQNDGVKENILLEKRNGRHEFSFHMKAPGLRPDCREGQQISFLDNSTGETVFTLGELFLRDSYTGKADGAEHLSFENKYRIEQAGKDNYILTYVLDRKFLNNKKTQYPILVDPSITPDKDVYDAPVYSGKAGQNFGANAYAQIGKVSKNFGVGYGYFQMQGVEDYTYINPKNLKRATLRVYEGSGTTYASKILAYDTSKEWRSAGIT